MPVEPANKIYSLPIIKREENVGSSPRKRPKQEKKKQEKESGKVDIRV